jgi:hypothetical protein
MLEWFLIGFLLGTIAALPVFPEHRNLWSWIWATIRKKRE